MLFDDFIRDYCGFKDHTESESAFLNRCARRSVEAVRIELERWFERYPESEQHELRIRFRSTDDHTFRAAFLELFLHELLLRLGHSVEIHPKVAVDTRKKPDFLVNLLPGGGFYLVAKIATGKSLAEVKTEARLNDFYQILDQVDCPDWILRLQADNFAPKTPLPASRIRSQVRQWLSTLDVDAVSTTARRDTFDDLPATEFEHEGRIVTVMAIPKKPEWRGRRSDDRPIGVFPSNFEWLNTHGDIADAIKVKSSRYGSLDRPYVIAIQSHYAFTRAQDFERAIFGDPQTPLPVDNIASAVTPLQGGVLTTGSPPHHRRVSAVLAIRQLYPWAVPKAQLCLYHNPSATLPLIWGSARLTEASPVDGRIEYRQGETTAALLGLADDWPGSDVDADKTSSGA
jgi:hypothetical protein